MRTIAELPHPDCKITIFSMNQKYLIKLEKGAFEQTYKLSELDVTNGVNGVFQLLDETFLTTAVRRFKEMRDDFNAAYQRNEP
ncbi:MAG: hypothetical protein RLZ47_22 [Bacteroidota bacterium]|jgi:hypothetical protein